MRILSLALLCSLFAVGCEGCALRTNQDNALPGAASSSTPQASGPDVAPSQSLLAQLGYCSISYEGVLLDLGTPFANVRRSYSVGPFDDVSNITRGGKTYIAALGRELSYGFWLQHESASLSVALRARAGLSERVSVYLDDERLGVVRLPMSDFATVVSAESHRSLALGSHTVTLRFEGRRAPVEQTPYAELDWVWVGNKADLTANYSPPTLDDIVADVALSGEPQRSLVLRAPAAVRCAWRPTRGETLEMGLGFWGQGQGTAQLRAVAEGEASVTLAEHAVQGGDQAAWKQVSVDLSRFEGKAITLELDATQIQGSGRIAFGEPAIRSANQKRPAIAQAQNVVLVLAGGLSRSALPPWGTAQGFRGLLELIHQGVIFNGYRAHSTVVTSVVASLLTGLPPRLHAVEDMSSKLPDSVFTIAETLKQHGGHSAMFTGVPTSFAAFGFDRGWDEFHEISPVLDQPATEPLTRASDWLAQQINKAPSEKHLLVVHLRGGHPPWDLSREETASLPPEEYAGMLDARRGGIILSELRGQPANSRRRMRAEDW
ncbi:MAG TPA: sulfatase-like hydrolase/transferase, partial [Polyangiaceae bacterium]|nr:sulfatase-like hydrolase/transferase [Polyangiaceae bacterium]